MIREMERIARTAILEAGALIRDQIGRVTSSQVHSKGISDYVTEVDEKSEQLIIGMIKKHFPDHHIMSEETPHNGMQNGITWVIDPLDGTTNFIHGFPFVAVSIAACMDGKQVLGLVLDPVRDELFVARRGEGAYLNDRRIQVRTTFPLEKALIATGFPFRSRRVVDSYLSTFKNIFLNVSGIRRAGAAALDLAYLAAGRVDGFWEVGLAPWDVAAGSLLVMEAGGLVSDFWEKEDYLLNGHIVAGTDHVYSFLLDQAREHLAPVLEDGEGNIRRRAEQI
ncbi:MAG: inositol monophosphatase family protein [Syntrophobacteraceae bacterium]